MTVPLQTRRSPIHLGNGVADSFAFDFKVFSQNDIIVTTATSAGVETLRVLNTDYTVSLNSDQDASPGGDITYPISGTKLQTGEKLVIVGNAVASQLTDLQSYGFYPQSVEDMADKLTMIAQQNSEKTGRSPVLPDTVTGVDLTLPVPSAGLLLGWNSAADGLANYAGLGAYAVSPYIELLLDDLDASAALTTLGVSPFVQAMLDDANSLAVRQTLLLDKRGADIASGGTLNLDTATGDYITVTGTTTVTTIQLAEGVEKVLRFSGAVLLTHSANLVLPKSENATTAAGDIFQFRGEAAGVVRCVGVMRAALGAGGANAATQAQQEAGTDVTVFTSPGRQQFHPSAAKWWCQWDSAGNILASYNVSTVTDIGTGRWGININNDLSSNVGVALAIALDNGQAVMMTVAGVVASVVTVYAYINVTTGTNSDGAGTYYAAGFGDLP